MAAAAWVGSSEGGGLSPPEGGALSPPEAKKHEGMWSKSCIILVSFIDAIDKEMREGIYKRGWGSMLS